MSADRRTRPQLLADIADLRAQLARVSASYAAQAEQAREVAHSPHSLFEEAPITEALDKAKQAGRDCVVAADPLPASDTDEGSGQLTAIDIP